MTKVFITHVTKEYLQVGLNLAKSLQEFSPTPLIVYFVGEEQPELDLFAEFPNASVRFIPMELEKFASGNDYSFANGGNFYVNRYSTKIYHILAAKTIAMEMALQEGWDQVCYLDSDCIATPLVDELFNWCDLIEDYPIATAGIHEYMIMIENGFQRGKYKKFRRKRNNIYLLIPSTQCTRTFPLPEITSCIKSAASGIGS